MNRLTQKISRSSVCFALLVSAALLALPAASASAAAPPALKVSTVRPDHATPGKGVTMTLNVLNSGGEPLSGQLLVKTTMPDGIAPGSWENNSFNVPDPVCQVSGQESECTVDTSGVLPGDTSGVRPGVRMVLRLTTTVEAGAAGVLGGGEIEVSGAGTASSFSEALGFTTEPIGALAIRALDVNVADAPTLPATQAGADPSEISTAFTLNAETSLIGGIEGDPQYVLIAPPEQFRDVITHVPAGVIGNPSSTPLRCTQAQLTSPSEIPGTITSDIPACPFESQVGLAEVNLGDIVPLYNLVPPPGYPAAFGFVYNGVVVTLLAKVRPTDNGIDIVAEKTADSVPLPRIEIGFWGVPSDPSHDPLRGVCLHGGLGYNHKEVGKLLNECALPVRSGTAFLRNPTSCPGTPLHWSIEMNTYQHPGTFTSKSTTTPAMEGCEALPFDPEISLVPTEHTARASSGLDAELTMPQNTDPDGLAEADLREAKVALPQGVSVNPASADGLGACSDAELRLGLEGPSQCPDSSKLGTLEVVSPLLEEPIGGNVFLRSQASKDPASGDLYRLAIELRSDERGVAIKLPGSLVADPNTGQLTATFKELPQLPFETMRLHFKSGPRAPLTLPSTCGKYTTHAELSSWSGKVLPFDSSFTLDKGCSAPPFSPGFEAGVTDNGAGKYSPLMLRVTRDAGEPNVSRIAATLPEGELAKFAGVTLCPESAMQSGNCPASSRIGTATAGIGEGSAPLFLPQAGKQPVSLYVGGPYKQAPYSVLTAVPAQAGPFDLGTVLVRSQVAVDPDSAQAEILSDPLPQIYGGIPVTYRDVRVNIDRPDFAINPTDCEPTATTGTISSALGQQAPVSDRFQVADCATLGFKPKLSLTLKGKVSRGSHPRLIANLKARPGDANIASARVKLPAAAFLDQSHIGTVCTRVQFAAAQCPKRSVYGHASATSPLLDYPLKGNVYLRSSSHKLPDLVVDLKGPYTTPIEVALAGKTDSVKGALRNTFEAVPDAPVSKFHLELFGGRKGLIEMSSGFCADPDAAMKLGAQNGKVLEAGPEVKAADCKSAKRSRHGKGR